MLLPTERSAGLAATNLMQSMLDKAEERRAEQDEKASGKKEDPVLKARVSMDETRARAKEKIETYLFDSSSVSVNELKLGLMERLGEALGIKQEDGESGFGWGRKLETALSTMDYAAKRALEKEVGLDELDLSIDTMIAAVKNPYADDAEKLKAALELKAGGGGDTHVNQSRVLQRLESVADPKTAEELKLEPQLNDPTRIEDDQVRQERAQEMSDLQAMDKLDDVRDLQEIAKQTLEATGADGEADASAQALDALSVLAGIADAGATADASSDSDDETLDAAQDVTEASDDPQTQAKSGMIEPGMEPTEDLPEVGDALDDQPLQIQIDEIGLYSLLEKKKAA
ncbi:hypothetical protein [Rhizobium sp.]